MNREEFTALLKKAGFNKKTFADHLEVAYQTVNGWGSNGRDFPYWVESWLNNYIKAKDMDKVVEAVKPHIKD